MAIRLPLKKIEAEKAEFIEYLKRYSTEPTIASKFPYKSFYENDPEVQKIRANIANNVIGKEKVNDKVIATTAVVSNKVKIDNSKEAKQIKIDRKKEKEKILHQLGEIQKQLKKGKDKIPQDVLDRYQQFIKGIDVEYQNLYQTKINEITKKIRAAQVVLYLQPVVLELTLLEREDNDVIFFEGLLKIGNYIGVSTE